MKYIRFCILLPLLTIQVLSAQTRLDDSLSLVDFYNTTDGPNWQSSWDLTMPMDTWHGITITNGRVTSFDLGWNINLNGPMLDFNLTALKLLRIVLNYELKGTIPDFSNLPALETLSLGHNQFSGPIPDFSNLPNLRELYLNDNQLTGPIPDFSNLPNLTGLSFLFNQVTGPIPDFSNLPNLTSLDLQYNLLTGTIPDFSNLSNLNDLLLHGNFLSGQIPDFSNLPNLYNLQLSSNRLTGAIPDFSYMPNLAYLFLEYNKLSGAIPDFSNLRFLDELWIHDNKLSGTIPDFSYLWFLDILLLHNNNLSGTIPDFSNLTSLNYLYLENNQLTGQIPDFSSLSSMKELILDNNQLTGTVPAFSNMNNLENFRIVHNKFTFEDIIGSLQFLRSLCNSNGPIGSYYYFAQDSIGTRDTLAIPINTSYTMDLLVDDNLTTNKYTWYKDGSPFLLTTINELTFPNFQVADEGVYHCAIANPQIPNLTLYSKPVTLIVDCGTSNEALETAPSPTICPEATITYWVSQNSTIYDRYIFHINGQVAQDSTTPVFITNSNIENLDTLTVIALDAGGCRYTISNPIVINAYVKPKVGFCTTTEDSLPIQLTNGSPPWSFDLHFYNETLLINTSSYTCYGLDTVLAKPPNTHAIVENVNLLQVNCNPATEVYTSNYISGCSAICVGYSNYYEEAFTANFSNNATNFCWFITPIVGESVVFSHGQGTKTIVLHVDNPNPVHSAITIQVTADTDCGLEVITKNVVLDQNCVWPGDVNDDGQVVLLPTNNSYIDDAIQLVNAVDIKTDLSTNGLDSLIAFKRDLGCLAEKHHDWVPQSSRNWLIQDQTNTTFPAMYPVVDNAGNTIDSINLKYADTNGDGDLNLDIQWTDTTTPFDSVANPTDHDIIAYHAQLNSQHNGNVPIPKNNSALHLTITTQDTVYNYGDSMIFEVHLGSPTIPVYDVRQLAFVGQGRLREFDIPVVKMDNSHFGDTPSQTSWVDYGFYGFNPSSQKQDSVQLFASISRRDTSLIFTGQEVCKVVCIVQPIEFFQAGGTSSTSKSPTDSIPVTFNINSAGAGHSDGSITYVHSNEITVWVRPSPTLNARVLLGGAFDIAQPSLMRDALRIQGYLPTEEPYQQMNGFYYPHPELKGIQIADNAVFTVSGPQAIVDWVFVEIRDPQDYSIIGTRAALVTRSGDLVDVDGVSPVSLPRLLPGNYHVAIRHRNHLPVMTMAPVYLSADSGILDFTTGNNATLQHELSPGQFGMIAGDIQQEINFIGKNHVIGAADRSCSWNNRNQFGYLRADADLSGVSDAGDRSIVWNNKNLVVLLP